MENNGPIIVGLDIGTTKVSVMIGRQDQFGKLEILGMGKAISGGVLRGIVANIDKTVESIKLAVEEAEQKSGTEIKEVYIGIAGQHIKSLQHRGEMVRDDIENEITIADMEKLRENMFKLVTVPGEEVIHVIPQEYTVDGEDGIQDPNGMSVIKLETAYKVFSTIIESAPDWAEGWNKRATVLYLMGRYQDSLKDIDEVLKRESRHFGALSGQGLVETKLENYEKAIKSYQAAQKIYPSIKTAKIMIPQLEELIKGRAI